MIDFNSLMSALVQLKQNPRKMLAQRFKLPENIGNDPSEILQHLLNSGQVSQAQVNQAMQMRKMFGR